MTTGEGGPSRLFSFVITLFRPNASDPEELIRFGDAHLREGRLDLALKAYSKAARADPGTSAEKKVAQVYGMMGRYMEAIASLDRAAAIDPADSFAWMGRGFLFLLLEMRRKALESFKRAAYLDPENGYARYLIFETAEEIRRMEASPRR